MGKMEELQKRFVLCPLQPLPLLLPANLPVFIVIVVLCGTGQQEKTRRRGLFLLLAYFFLHLPPLPLFLSCITS